MNLKEFLTTVSENPHADIDFIVQKIKNFYRGRPYHNLQHIQECIRTFNLLDIKTDDRLDPDLVKLALIFHDLIWTPDRTDNEERSAFIANVWMRDLGLTSENEIDIVTVSIEMTKHTKAEHDILLTGRINTLVYEIASIVCDCDLSILAAPKERFDEYENQIRQEYKDVPDLVFFENRSKIMQGFLERSRIYLNDEFYFAFETKARKNLEKYEVVHI